jgi:hypothetical protein
MVDRSMMHLVPGELMKYFDGPLTPGRVREHLNICFLCRSRLRDLALTRIMVCPPRAEAPGGHVSPETLARYVEDRLPLEQVGAMEQHLGSCRRCLSDLVSLRTALKMPLDKMPAERDLERVRRFWGGSGN